MKFATYTLSETLKKRGPVVTRRGKQGDQSVILKILQREAVSPDMVEALRREYRLIREIDSPRVVKALELTWDNNCPALVLQDHGGQILGERISQNPPSMAEALRICIALARALEAVHEAGIMHGDINPHNVLVGETPNDVVLIDFGFSERGGLPPREGKGLRGSPDYIAPEMTGRLSLGADHRADLYSLGIMLFEMLTGELPFPPGDLLQKVYAHLALQPRPLRDLLPTVPDALVSVVNRLMAKQPEQRYQTVSGLLADLEYCLALVEGAPIPEAYELGASDIPRRLSVSMTQRGRDAEREKLRLAFDAIRTGKPSGMTLEISGRAGVGKSTLVESLRSYVDRSDGLFVVCNVDADAHGDAEGGLIEAASALAELLLTGRYGALEDWSRILRDGMGEMLSVLAGLGPELAALVGESAPATQLQPRENAERLGLALRRFLRLGASQAHPLVLVAEDVHAADFGTLNLLNGLPRPEGPEHLLLLLTRRERMPEADADAQATGAAPSVIIADQTLRLGELSAEAVAEILSETFRQPNRQTLPLAQALVSKVGGVPLSVGQFLGALVDQDIIRFDPQKGEWQWDLVAIRAGDAGENVVDLLLSRGQSLTELERAAIGATACVGRTFTMAQAEAASGVEPGGLSDALERAVAMGWLVPVFSSGDGKKNPGLRFVHERVWNAARELAPHEVRQAAHGRLAQDLLHQAGGEPKGEILFDIARHLSSALTSEADPDTRSMTRNLNAAAGGTALAAGDLRRSHEHFSSAVALLDETDWAADPGGALEITGGAGAAAMLVGAFENADGHFETFLDHCPEPKARAGIHALRLFSQVGQNRSHQAIEIGRSALAELEDPLPDTPGPAEIEAEVGGIFAALGGRGIDTLSELPAASDPARVAVQQVLDATLFPSFSVNPLMFAVVAARLTARAITDGFTEHSAVGFNDFGLVCCGPMNQVEMGYGFSMLARGLIETHELDRLRPRVDTIFNAFVRHRRDPIRDTLAGLEEARRAGVACGDTNMAGLASFDHAFQLFWIGERMEQADEAFAQADAFCKDLKIGIMPDLIGLYRQTLSGLRQRPEHPDKLSGPYTDGESLLETYRQRHDANGMAQLHIAQMLLAHIHGQRDAALQQGRMAYPVLDGITSTPAQPAFFAHFAMIAVPAAEGVALSDEDHAILMHGTALTSYWAEQAPMNYRHHMLVVSAELALAEGDDAAWLEGMEAAADHATQQSFTRDAAMILERIAEVSRARGRQRRYAHFIRDAWRAWVHYGAEAKVADLSAAHHEELDRFSAIKEGAQESLSLSMRDEQLDLGALLKSTRAISQEVRVSQLLRALLAGVVETAGASSALVVAPDGSDFRLIAQLKAGDQGPVFASEPDVGSARLCQSDMAPLSALRLVTRSQQAISTSDVASDTRLSSDPFFAQRAPKSLAIVPLINGGRVLGLVYLENDGVADAFSGLRLNLLDALCAQAAISWDNALLYDRQSNLLEAADRFVPAELARLFNRSSIEEVQLTDARASRMTVMVSDLRGSSSAAETLDPRQTFARINAFLGGFSSAVREHGGFVLKYMGDGVLALFPDGSDTAMSAAVTFQRWLEKRGWDPQEGDPLNAGIAIHCGEIMFGVVGDGNRMQIDALSDAVNVAFRLEKLTKRFGAKVLISDEALDDTGKRHGTTHKCRYLGEVETLGRQSLTRIHELVDAEPEQVRLAKIEALELFEQGVRMFEGGDWVNACVSFSSVLRDNPGDAAASGLFQEAARRMRQLDSGSQPAAS
ncbi:protein kinase domain-containing protein [Primorskyibacter sp. S87]|uniref:protein kinase domain-containing protein n=1 Tax=Primorskyibacter sp. S87 TaxID=3415126 RepID=UPI003C7E6B31